MSQAGAFPQQPWQLPSATLSQPLGLATGSSPDGAPVIGRAADGSTTVLWLQTDGTNLRVMASSAPSGGAWSTPVALSAAGSDAQRFPTLSVGADGTAAAVWVRNNGTKDVVQASMRAPGEDWGSPVTLSDGVQNAARPTVAVGSDGRTTVVWDRVNGVSPTRWYLQSSVRPAGSSFSAPITISAAWTNANWNTPKLGVAANGKVILAYSSSNPLVVMTLPVDGAWSSPVTVAGTSGVFDPRIAVAPDGTATIVWWTAIDFADVGAMNIRATTRTPDGVFSAPLQLSPLNLDAYNPRVAVGADGTTAVVWDSDDGNNSFVGVATRSPGGSFTAPVDLTPATDNQDAFDARVTVADDGTVTAFFTGDDDFNEFMWAATMPAGGSFGDPVDLSGTNEFVTMSSAAASADGTLAVAWLGSDGLNYSVQAAFTGPEPAAPIVSTGEATSISSTQADLNGTVNANGKSTVYRFEYGVGSHETYDGRTSTVVTGSGRKDIAVTQTIDKLLPKTTYRYRVLGISGAGTTYGDDVTFTTGSVFPVVTTDSVTGIDRHAATFNSSVQTLDRPTLVWFEYGTNDRYGMTTNPADVVDGPVTLDVTGLDAGTTYHVRSVTGNDLGETVYGSDVTFATAAAAPPTVVTTDATPIDRTTATLNATVDPRFDDTAYSFEYGLTDKYGEPAGKGKVERNRGAQPATAGLTDLTPGTTYHFRVLAENQDGMSYGKDATFTTALDPPQAQSGQTQDITQTALTVTGAIDTGGLSTDWHVDYGATDAYGQVTDTVRQTTGGTVSVRLTGLSAGSAYHFRFVVENADGIRYSTDQQVTTSSAPAATPPVTTVEPVPPVDAAPPIRPTVTFKRLAKSAAIRVTSATALVRARCEQPVGATCTASVNLYERVRQHGKLTLTLLGHGQRTMKAGRTRTAVVTVTLTARGRELIRKTAGTGSPALWVTVRLRARNGFASAPTKFVSRPVRLTHQD